MECFFCSFFPSFYFKGGNERHRCKPLTVVQWSDSKNPSNFPGAGKERETNTGARAFRMQSSESSEIGKSHIDSLNSKDNSSGVEKGGTDRQRLGRERERENSAGVGKGERERERERESALGEDGRKEKETAEQTETEKLTDTGGQVC